MFCSKCGTKLDDSAKFCGSCGAMTAKPAAPPAPAPAPAPTPVPPPQYHAAPPAPAPAPTPVPPPQYNAAPPAPVPVPPPQYNAAPPAPAPAPIPVPIPVQPRPQPQQHVQPPVQPQQQVQYQPQPQQHVQPPVQPQQQVQYQPQPQPQAQPQAQPVYQQQYSQSGQTPLRYEIFGANLPAVTIRLNTGESIYTQSGGMVWMDSGIVMTTNMKGGLMKGLGRMISGDSLFIANYEATMPEQEITLASSFPGSIAHVELIGNSIIAQKSSFLCAQPGITLSVYVTKTIGAGLFGGEGFILQKMAGFGHLFLEIDGSLVERTLRPGEKLKVDTGNVAAFEESVQYQSEMVKGFKNVLFGGEGLFLTTLTGPGKVWLQTMTLPSFAKQLIPYLPKPSGN